MREKKIEPRPPDRASEDADEDEDVGGDVKGDRARNRRMAAPSSLSHAATFISRLL